MKLLIFDTETTGLFNKKERDLSKQPHIIQWASVLVDMDVVWNCTELSRMNILIKPPIDIPAEASEIHHIYNIDVKEAYDFEFWAEEIQRQVNEADAIVWHNVEFDETMVRIEFDRLKMKWRPFDFSPKMSICTMNEWTSWCKLPKKWTAPWYKRPKLQELAVKAWVWHFAWAHDAIIDVEYTLRCLQVMAREWVIRLEESNLLTLWN